MVNQEYRNRTREITNEAGFTARQFVKVALIVMLAFSALGGVGYILGWFGETAQIAQQELGPQALLKKYQWFKDAAAQLDAKAANIEVYRKRQTEMKASYANKPRSDWDRTDKEQFNLWEQEVSGMVASYNNLAAEYNAAMAKANWAFANVGNLPQGADKVLPREYRTYQTN